MYLKYTCTHDTFFAHIYSTLLDAQRSFPPDSFSRREDELPKNRVKKGKTRHARRSRYKSVLQSFDRNSQGDDRQELKTHENAITRYHEPLSLGRRRVIMIYHFRPEPATFHAVVSVTRYSHARYYPRAASSTTHAHPPVFIPRARSDRRRPPRNKISRHFTDRFSKIYNFNRIFTQKLCSESYN